MIFLRNLGLQASPKLKKLKNTGALQTRIGAGQTLGEPGNLGSLWSSQGDPFLKEMDDFLKESGPPGLNSPKT